MSGINWATHAPETRIYKNKVLYKWEDSPGLEHHYSRAKTSCIGKHVEPCYRFHQQLHFVGKTTGLISKSHECFGCNSSDRLHYTRHREILKLVREISASDDTATVLALGYSNNHKPRRESSTTNTTFNTSQTDTGSETVSIDEAKVTRRERKKLKKAGNGNAKDRKPIELFPADQTDFVSEAIHLRITESKGAWQGTYDYEQGTKTPAVEELADVITENYPDHEEQSMAMYPDALAVQTPGTPVKIYNAALKDLAPRQRNSVVKMNTATKYSSKGSNSRKFASKFPPEKTDPLGDLDPQIFFRLGVDVDPPNSSKTRRVLIGKLIAAIKEDIKIIDQEVLETKTRREGFIRWAGKAAYEAILAIRKHLDWATGQKIPSPTLEYFPNDEVDPKGIDGSHISHGTGLQELPTVRSPKINTRSGSKALSEENDGFTVASYRKKITGKKFQGNKKKPSKMKFNNTQAALDIDEAEDEGGDVHEMIRRYEQRKAGDRNLGGLHKVGGAAPDRRTARGRILVVK
ncbi:hypothetical protein QTJ16_006350 [Diplocarpon rosae]|uniref:Uncharacterized protein n=1 Tax=Diplocarpon rosae TaxID=946125 RepID=A0AAD9SVE3_9HELO|nr:hypothetical protein QTJ16_006350 [Diplocarpon rosae]